MIKKTNRITLLSLYLFMIVTISFINYQFFINDFKALEERQNSKNIKSLLIHISSDISILEGINRDYSKSDYAYMLLNSPKDSANYKNFKEGSTTLEDLGFDFMIIANSAEEAVFTNYSNSFLQNQKDSFEDAVFNEFASSANVATIFRFNKSILYLVKTTILQKDDKTKSQGTLYSGKVITPKSLWTHGDFFDEISIGLDKKIEPDTKIDNGYLGEITVETYHNHQEIFNKILFFFGESDRTFTLETRERRDIVISGRDTIVRFNIIIFGFLSAIFIIIYINQRKLEESNTLLEYRVEKRTEQLNKNIKKVRIKNKELHELATRDYLTKIYNRRSFFLESERNLKVSVTKDFSFYVLLIDLDDFKIVNDTYGHGAGDAVLVKFCEVVKKHIQEDAVFGRIGGEEFCISLIKKDLQEVLDLAESIRVSCEKSIVNNKDHEISYTISIGIAEKMGQKDIDDIIHRADVFLYKAKELGRNQVVYS